MDAGDDHIEFGKEVVVKVQFSLTKDVHFGTGEQPETETIVSELLIEFLDGLDLLAELGCIQPVGLERGLRVIRDGPIVAAEILGMSGNFLQRLMSIAPGRVVMQRAAEVCPFNQSRKFTLLG